MTACITCLEHSTTLYRADDGHFHKRCSACGHSWGPFTSSYGETHRDTERRTTSASGPSETTPQPSLNDYTERADR